MEKLLDHYSYESANDYLFIHEITTAKGDHKTGIIFQFMKKFYYQCGRNISYTTSIGDKSTHHWNNSFINIEYHEAVYPILTFMNAKKACIDQLWVQNSDNNQWYLVYPFQEHNHNDDRYSEYIFVPFHSNFKTKMFRLEFPYGTNDYTLLLDDLMLIGTSDLILPEKNLSFYLLMQSIRYYGLNASTFLRDGIFNSSDYLINCIDSYCTDANNLYNYSPQKFRDNCVISESAIRINLEERFRNDELEHKQVSQSFKPGYNKLCFLLDDSNWKEDSKLSLDEPKELSRCYFLKLPTEMILEILTKLDPKSLCRVSGVNKCLNGLSRDLHLYKDLNIRDIHFTYWHSNIHCKFDYFTFRRISLSQLDLSLCDFLVSKFIALLDSCGSRLTHLKLNECASSIDDFALRKISQICKKLKGFDLSYCTVSNKGISFLEKLKFLERLHLEEVNTETQTLCRILRENPHMRDLKLSCMRDDFNADSIAIELKDSCPNLQRLNLTDTLSLTSRGVDALANCKNLQEITFNTVDFENVSYDSFRGLLSSCQRLEDLELICIDCFTDRQLRGVTLCKNLKCLKTDTQILKLDICSELFMECPKLEKITLKDTPNYLDYFYRGDPRLQ